MPYSALKAKEISELCIVVDCEHKTAPYVEKSEYLVVRTSNVRNGQLLMKNMKYTTDERYEEWTQRAIPKYGDVFFTREAPAGESCLVPRDRKVCMGQRMVILRPKKDKVDPVFLSLILNTERAKADILRLAIGSTVSRINISDIKRLKIASPELPEQRKIAKILSTWDKAIVTMDKLIESSKQQKKALMQQLLTGKKRLINPEAGVPFRGDWEDKYLNEIAQVIVSPVDKKTIEGEIPVELCNYTDVYYNNRITRKLSFMRATAKQSEIDKFTLEIDDVIITKDSETPGDIAVPSLVSEDLRGVLCGYHLAIVRPKKATVDGGYMNFLFSTQKTRYYFFTLANGATRFGLSVGGINKAHFRLPNLKEQQKIASVLTTADKEIELLDIKLAHLQQEKKALMQQLLTGKRRVKVEKELEITS